MLIRVPADRFRAAAALAARVATRRTTSPILNALRVDATADGTAITATDLQSRIRVPVDAATVDVAGSVLLNPLKLLPLLAELGTCDITLDARNPLQPVITAPGSRYRFLSAAPAGFPEPEPTPHAVVVTVSRGALRGALGRVVYAAATLPTAKPAYTAVHVEAGEGTLDLVATDAARLALASLEASLDHTNPLRAQLPAGAASVLAHLLGDGAGEAVLCFSPRTLSVALAGLTFSTQLLQDSFPAFRSLLQATPVTTVLVGREILTQAVQRATILADGHLYLQAEDDTLTITAGAAAQTSREEVPASVVGRRLDKAFSPKLVAEALLAVTGETCRIQAFDRGDQVVLCNPAQPAELHMLSPLRV